MTEENKITINDKEYNVAELDQNQQYFIAQIKDLDAKVGNLKFQLDQVSVAKDSFTQALIKSVEEVKDETEDGNNS
jgi:cell division protein ZapA (FtsZ GTPase activity inhibitor)